MTRKEALEEIRQANAEGRPANLRGADLCRANLVGAYLRGADLCRANLAGADLCRANLAGANLTGANLTGANLAGANLYCANLTCADLGGLLVVARATRSDGYEYFCWTSVLGGLVIRAGCRTWLSFEEARKHCRTVTDEKYRAEALRIIDYLEVCYVAQ